ncbi:ABC transporter, permease component [gamma proteobacterium HdN1]|nr:ABC transporter, permease component [gamma proteobacterium HdN1]
MSHIARKPHTALWCALLIVALLLAAILGVGIGSVSVSFADTMAIFQHRLAVILGTTAEPSTNGFQYQIVWNLRLPRVLLAALVGAGLAVVGAIMQAMVRNPLADPYLLGTSSGASVGAVCVLAWGSFGIGGTYAMFASAFFGSLIATAAVYFLARTGGQLSSIRLILSGVAVAYMLSGLTSLIILTSGDRGLATSVLTWILGSLAGTQWDTLALPAITLAVGLFWAMAKARTLNALLLGEEMATTLGVETQRQLRKAFVVVSLLTAVMVAVSGTIGFVGLVIPHIVRMLVGTDHRRLLPVSALAGAVFLVLVDLASRTLFAPTEVPVGVITALIGGPFFMWMLARPSRIPSP